jgi:hypothetical protein
MGFAKPNFSFLPRPVRTMTSLVRGSLSPITRRRNVTATPTTLQSHVKRKILSRKKIVAFLFVSTFVIVFSALVFHWEQPQHDAVRRDDPIVTAKKAFSLLSPTKNWTQPQRDAVRRENPVVKAEKKYVSLLSPTVRTSLCFPFNSPNWLKGPRLGNYNDSFLYNNTSVRETLLWESTSHQMQHFFSTNERGLAKTIFSQTICHENSRFLNLSSYTDLRMWALRLIYLSVHLHQHEPAMLEAKHRYSLSSALSKSCQTEYQRNQVGAYDYECPKAKFLVVAMGRLGLGAVMRLGAVNYYIAGISTGRVVLFVNNYHAANYNKTSTKVPKFLQDPWMHASCPRHDVQCFFWPSSPCVITVQELEDAYFLSKSETRQVFRTGAVPTEHTDDRVILMDMTLRPQRCPETFFPTLRNISLTRIIEPLKQQSPTASTSVSLEQIHFLERAAEHILDPDMIDPTRSYYYFGQSSKAHHAMVFYATRPNLYYAQRMQQIIAKTVPRDVNPEFSLGLPIRGMCCRASKWISSTRSSSSRCFFSFRHEASDKCLMESECLPFTTYMKIMGQIWKTHVGNGTAGLRRDLLGNVIVTSESGNVVRDKVAFESNQTMVQSLPFSLRFVMNEDDVLQGTGLPRNFHIRSNQSGTPYSEDDIMLSAVTSLKVQLMAKYTIGNCCSNFHLLLFDFLRDGCGAATESIHRCLQENENPEFRVCCMWSDSPECKLRKQIREAKEKKRTKTKAAKE